ncbi:hypothetical protein, partial [Mycobacteroides abscessus]
LLGGATRLGNFDERQWGISASAVTQVGSDAFDDLTFDVSMMLELGVSRPTEVSLMALGLSRTTTIAVSELIIDDDLEPADALAWLRQQDLEALALPVLVRREVQVRLAADVEDETA